MLNKQNNLTNTPALLAENISKSFGTKTILKNISFKLNKKSGLCICGSNACGKTTLIKILAGIIKPQTGTIKINNIDTKKASEKTTRKIGLISHNSMLYPQMTTEENLNFFASLYNIKNKTQQITQMIEKTNLTRFRHDTVNTLSRGTTQRLSIARALLHNPTILLADEPFTGLDTDSIENFINIINFFQDQGGSVIITTHHLQLAAKCCQTTALIKDGKLLEDITQDGLEIKTFYENYPG